VQIAVVLVLLGVVGVLLATERLREDLVAMLALSALVVLQLVSPAEVLSGFSNPATVAVACMFLLSAGLQSSGFVEFMGDRLLKAGPHSSTALILLSALVIGPVSAFINNTAAVAVFLPVALRASHGSGVSPSRVLMPLSFFAMLGGMCTLIGTSTNILVSSLASQHGIRPFEMFEFTPLGLILFVAGLVHGPILNSVRAGFVVADVQFHGTGLRTIVQLVIGPADPHLAVVRDRKFDPGRPNVFSKGICRGNRRTVIITSECGVAVQAIGTRNIPRRRFMTDVAVLRAIPGTLPR